ncbi:hypothetical protein TSAR_015041, partial [Trichomalopsis sarcophagae]
TINKNFVNVDGNESSSAIRGFLRSLNTNIVTATLPEKPGAQTRHNDLLRYLVPRVDSITSSPGVFWEFDRATKHGCGVILKIILKGDVDTVYPWNEVPRIPLFLLYSCSESSKTPETTLILATVGPRYF